MDENAALTDLAEITVNPDVLKWARVERGLSIPAAAKLLVIEEQQLEALENGTKRPSVTLLRRMANRYEINFVSLLLPEKPAPVAKLHDFRTPTGRHGRVLTLETIVAIQDVRDSLEAFAELRASDESAVTLPRLDRRRDGETPEQLAERQRRIFGIDVDTQRKWPSPAHARDEWRRLIESHGVFVYLKRMGAKDCRGFSMMYRGLAAICVNDREAIPGAEAFTLWHEYGHLLLRRTGISDENRQNSIEHFCNRFAASFLIPLVPLRDYLKSPSEPIDFSDETITRLANRFKVSRRAMALRLEHAGLAPKGFYAARASAWDIPKSRKADAFTATMTAVQRAARILGAHHTRTVLRAYKSGLMTAIDAHNLLDVPIPSFRSLGAAVE